LGIKVRWLFLASNLYGMSPIALSKPDTFHGTEIRYGSIAFKGYYSYHVCFQKWQQSDGKSCNSIAMVVVVQVELEHKDMKPFNSPERPDMFIQVFLSIISPCSKRSIKPQFILLSHFCQPVITQAMSPI
jgi:hypothetical protein